MSSNKQPRSKRRNSNVSDGGNVKVYCRVRPHNRIETDRGGKECLITDETSIQLQTVEENQLFTFDHVFQENSSQVEVFDRVARPVVQGK